MSGRVTMWGAGQILCSFFSKSTEPPASFYLALIREIPPTAYVSGSELDEPEVTTGYARVEIPNTGVYWNNSSQPHIVSLAESLAFITAVEDWGPVKYWALCNAPVDGYVYFTGTIEDQLIVADGDAVVVAADDLAVSLGPFFTEDI